MELVELVLSDSDGGSVGGGGCLFGVWWFSFKRSGLFKLYERKFCGNLDFLLYSVSQRKSHEKIYFYAAFRYC